MGRFPRNSSGLPSGQLNWRLLVSQLYYFHCFYTHSNLRMRIRNQVFGIRTFVSAWGEGSRSQYCVSCTAWYLWTAVLAVAKRAMLVGKSSQTRYIAWYRVSRRNRNLPYREEASVMSFKCMIRCANTWAALLTTELGLDLGWPAIYNRECTTVVHIRIWYETPGRHDDICLHTPVPGTRQADIIPGRLCSPTSGISLTLTSSLFTSGNAFILRSSLSHVCQFKTYSSHGIAVWNLIH